jgi:endonuclease/exonuclease/phosphatase family metal-dependent hydrolase
MGLMAVIRGQGEYRHAIVHEYSAQHDPRRLPGAVSATHRDVQMTVEIKLATYNTMNLFDSLHPREAKPKRELQSLAYTVDGMRPDILALQEVGSEAALNELNERLKEPFPYLGLIAGNSERSISLAFMSRIAFDMTSHARQVLLGEHGGALLEYRSRADHWAQLLSPLLFQRDWLLGEFHLGPGVDIALFNGHLKSRKKCSWHLNATDDIRLAEARTAAQIVRTYQQRHPQIPVVVMGDFNEGHEHPSVQPLVNLSGFSDPIRDELITNNRLVTTYWAKQRERIDHVQLCETARCVYVSGSAAIIDHAGARKASDHLPVMVTLRL